MSYEDKSINKEYLESRERLANIEHDEKSRFANGIEYKVEVVETFTLRRSYVVTARSRQEARQLAKDMDWDDAWDGWESDGSDSIESHIRNHQVKHIEVPELQKSTVKKIRKY